MDEQIKELMETIEDSSNVSIEDILRIAEAIQHSDLTNENVVRQLVKQLAYLSNRTISTEKEEQIVQSIVNGNIPTSFDELRRYF